MNPEIFDFVFSKVLSYLIVGMIASAIFMIKHNKKAINIVWELVFLGCLFTIGPTLVDKHTFEATAGLMLWFIMPYYLMRKKNARYSNYIILIGTLFCCLFILIPGRYSAILALISWVACTIWASSLKTQKNNG